MITPNDYDSSWYPTDEDRYDNLYWLLEDILEQGNYFRFIEELRATDDPYLQTRLMEYVNNLELDTLGTIIDGGHLDILQCEIGGSVIDRDLSGLTWNEAQNLLPAILERLEIYETYIDKLEDGEEEIYQMMLDIYDMICWAGLMETRLTA